MEEILANLVTRNRSFYTQGRVATYIPELALASPDILGISLATVEGERSSGGDGKYLFSIQSISKIISLALALEEVGEEIVFDTVGMDPTPDPFNSIMRLEMHQVNRPYNPVVNAGAIAVVSLIPRENGRERGNAVLDLARRLMGNPELEINQKIFESEKETGHRNRSLAYYMKSTGTLKGDVEDVLEGYFRQCSIEASVEDLGVLGATLATGGINPVTGVRVLASRTCRIIRALMVTCGMYDGSGEFALRVGIPAKSGVGGGIVAVVPGRMGIGVCGPSLDSKGNSLCGMKLLEDLSRELKLRVL
ncbi:MAG TPA: glutaminase A [Synergistaceae bacterium]|nr:glutaminase A [Synergistaceae bacterium]HPJ25995.1 glutaminase A [Synergistaceae bacterium]HPQ37303.1 glutaminase A [Synergistaceae bacterium]